MSGELPDAIGLEGAREALAAGRAIVLPHPWPLPYGVVGTDPRAVNTAKRRPAAQSVAFWAHGPDGRAALAPALALGAAELDLLERLLVDELLTVLVPVRAATGWLAPATLDGWALVFGGRWQPLDPLLEEFPVLYASSANLTGRPPVADTEEALAAFHPATPVLHLAEPPELRAEQRRAAGRRSTTTVRLHTGGHLTLYRQGVQDAAHPSPEAYLRYLVRRYRRGS
ncbi:hypothetical protein ACFYNO_31355 [Kitasatospora sp. NPDC006697]|uniref:hypothetical protein n=1 Tax=Kitasatospora sp. NPDC006697 TaxID=3364020 RepID=UPI00369FE5E1